MLSSPFICYSRLIKTIKATLKSICIFLGSIIVIFESFNISNTFAVNVFHKNDFDKYHVSRINTIAKMSHFEIQGEVNYFSHTSKQ